MAFISLIDLALCPSCVCVWLPPTTHCTRKDSIHSVRGHTDGRNRCSQLSCLFLLSSSCVGQSSLQPKITAAAAAMADDDSTSVRVAVRSKNKQSGTHRLSVKKARGPLPFRLPQRAEVVLSNGFHDNTPTPGVRVTSVIDLSFCPLFHHPPCT
ncbi:hypothetical protein DAPPUDRAFT_116101 [Daphnia pulex]|uniref:Secreted protein n=1 Tax=Daphnia pulex TaxID=6669 RepID=E9HNJ0_DAPPU|nr:hypothetical protein DAPPUDRAFT_116101 [Daphnia pulex]|eukprot:EFX66704.1 hypothetical protein DAPPUDRAFT_116101 [Daphnia pulex]